MSDRTELDKLETLKQALKDAADALASGRYDFALHKNFNGLIEHASGIILTLELSKQRHQLMSMGQVFEGSLEPK